MSVQWLLIALPRAGRCSRPRSSSACRWCIPLLDFEGQNGMLVCIPVWFLGGLLVGHDLAGAHVHRARGRELLVAIPTTFLLIQSQTVRTMPLFLYLIFAAIGILLTLIGAYIGERIQLGPPPKTAGVSRLRRRRHRRRSRRLGRARRGSPRTGGASSSSSGTRHPRFHLGESLLPDSMGGARGHRRARRGARALPREARSPLRRRCGRAAARAVRYAFAEAFHAPLGPRVPGAARRVRRAALPPRGRVRRGACARDGRPTRVVFDGDARVGRRGPRTRTAQSHALERALRRRRHRARRPAGARLRRRRSASRTSIAPRSSRRCAARGATRASARATSRSSSSASGRAPAGSGSSRSPTAGRASAPWSRAAWVRARGASPAAPRRSSTRRWRSRPRWRGCSRAPTASVPPRRDGRLQLPRRRAVRGDGWLAVGDAGGFIDPLFSTGAHLAMHGALARGRRHRRGARRRATAAERSSAWEREMRAGARAVHSAPCRRSTRATSRRYLFADPQHPFLRRAITSMLAGDVFAGEARRIGRAKCARRFPA